MDLEPKKIKSILISKPTTEAIATIENDLKKEDPSIEKAIAKINESSKDFYGSSGIIANCLPDNTKNSTK